MSTLTPNYSLIKSGVNDPTDQDLWGGYLNTSLDIIDSQMKTNNDLAQDASDAVDELLDNIGNLLTISINGGTLSIPSSSTLGVSATKVYSDDGEVYMNLPTMTKSLSSWSSGSGNGSLDTGTISSDSFYYVFVICNPTDPTYDVLISLSRTSPVMPSGFTKKRYLGAIITNQSSALYSVTQIGDYFLYDSPPVSNTVNVSTSAVDLVARVPPNLIGKFSIYCSVPAVNQSAQVNFRKKGTPVPDSSVSYAYARTTNGGDNVPDIAVFDCQVDSNSTIIAERTTGVGVLNIGMVVRGWVDPRNP